MSKKNGSLIGVYNTTTPNVASGIWSLSDVLLRSNDFAWPGVVIPGGQAYNTPGTYTWVAPTNVTTISIVAIGGGSVGFYGGAGGGLGWKNNLTVSPGSSYTVVVGAGAAGTTAYPGNPGGSSYVTVGGTNYGANGGQGSYTAGGPLNADGGGSGGTQPGYGNGAGGGAGGYTGSGGYAAFPGIGNTTGDAGVGGGGGGGAQQTTSSIGGGGGGASIYGGTGGRGGTSESTQGALGGTGPVPGNPAGGDASGVFGGFYGGGGAGVTNSFGGGGAVRIIWPGSSRQFPSTNINITNETQLTNPSPPVNTVLPTISGTAAIGQTLTVTTGTWTGSPTPSYAYQWQRGTTNISGATSNTYTIVSADGSNTLRCVVTATNFITSVSATSANTATVPALDSTGQQQYVSPGTYSWVAPTGVSSVSVVCVGGGAGAPQYTESGSGGGLGWRNNVGVFPGTSYTVVVGSGGGLGGNGGDSYFINTSTVRGIGGVGRTSPGSYVAPGGGGGTGGAGASDGGGWVGGGGAAGYTGNGGAGTGGSGNSTVNPGSGGGGAGGAGSSYGSGGGVGLLGQGTSGSGSPGAPGSGGSGKVHGGGGGWNSSGGEGGVRIIWGSGRAYPSTNTSDVTPSTGQFIVTSGLTVFLDATNSSSYPGSGSTWFDLSGNGNHMTLFNSPSFSTNNGGILQFNGSNQYGTIAGLNYSTSTFTIMAGTRYSGSTRGRVVSSVNNNWLFGHWSGSALSYYAEGWIINNSANDTNWRIYTGTENYGANQRSFYVNNSALVINSSSGSQGFNGLSLGRSGIYTSELSTCEASFIAIYNRILTAEEMTQNYNVLKTRLGL